MLWEVAVVVAVVVPLLGLLWLLEGVLRHLCCCLYFCLAVVRSVVDEFEHAIWAYFKRRERREESGREVLHSISTSARTICGWCCRSSCCASGDRWVVVAVACRCCQRVRKSECEE